MTRSAADGAAMLCKLAVLFTASPPFPGYRVSMLLYRLAAILYQAAN
jgi:hypothetical protein